MDGLTKEIGIVHSNCTLSCLTLYSVGKVFIGKSAPSSVANVDSYRSSLPEDEQQKLSADPTGPFLGELNMQEKSHMSLSITPVIYPRLDGPLQSIQSEPTSPHTTTTGINLTL